MSKKNPKVKIRGPGMGYCNICERFDKLTDDHVPPRGSANMGAVEIRTFSDHFSHERTSFHLSQKGLLIRSLCGDCNNGRLGKLYDPHLNKISLDVKKLVNAYNDRRLIWPDKISVSITPQRVARAIVGHLLAGSISDDAVNTPVKESMPDGLRKYFLDSSSPFPKELEIFYWLYLSNVQKILKGFGVAIQGNGKPIIGEVLKFFPLAYWVVWDKPATIQINLPKLIKNRMVGIDDTDEIEIDFHNVPRYDWPENPDDNMVILYRDDATKVASPAMRRKRLSNP